MFCISKQYFFVFDHFMPKQGASVLEIHPCMYISSRAAERQSAVYRVAFYTSYQ